MYLIHSNLFSYLTAPRETGVQTNVNYFKMYYRI